MPVAIMLPACLFAPRIRSCRVLNALLAAPLPPQHLVQFRGQPWQIHNSVTSQPLMLVSSPRLPRTTAIDAATDVCLFQGPPDPVSTAASLILRPNEARFSSCLITADLEPDPDGNLRASAHSPGVTSCSLPGTLVLSFWCPPDPPRGKNPPLTLDLEPDRRIDSVPNPGGGGFLPGTSVLSFRCPPDPSVLFVARQLWMGQSLSTAFVSNPLPTPDWSPASDLDGREVELSFDCEPWTPAIAALTCGRTCHSPGMSVLEFCCNLDPLTSRDFIVA